MPERKWLRSRDIGDARSPCAPGCELRVTSAYPKTRRAVYVQIDLERRSLSGSFLVQDALRRLLVEATYENHRALEIPGHPDLFRSSTASQGLLQGRQDALDDSGA